MLKLASDTDPSTVMFEGHPEIKIVAIGSRHLTSKVAVFAETAQGFEKLWDAGTMHLNTPTDVDMATHFSAFFHPDGRRFTTPNCDQRDVPRIVKRMALDPSKPLIATNVSTDSCFSGNVHEYDLVETIIPADGSEPRLHVKRRDNNAGVQIYASTGRVVSGFQGSALQFSNPPETKTHLRAIQTDLGTLDLIITTTDNVVTGVTLSC